ncbi:MAG: hypothetical protein H7Y20_16870, partial [Bryobacteraceae bacterium]|nr:hypothetical protein [Bryobacteraceae bacterium]
MSNLFSSLRATATALDALQRSAAASENNVTNASTPGYARQRIQLKSLEFNSAGGLTGGVSAGGLISSRDQYVEESVRQQSSKLGQAQETSIQLTGVDSAFNLNDSTGIAPNLDKLFT